MKAKTIAGNFVEIDLDEAMRIHDVVAGKPEGKPEHAEHLAAKAHDKHTFHIDGKEVAMTAAEMKMIADMWWDKYGKSAMEKFFTEYQQKAGKNIAAALNRSVAPKDEPEVKKAISMAICSNNLDTIGEVLFEAMEWCCAYTNLESIGE